MTTGYEIPLSPQNQFFNIALNGTYYQLTTTWRANSDVSGWFLDIADAQGNPLVQGIAIVTGADLLEQYAYLGIGGQLWVGTDGNPDAVPGETNLGITSHLWFVPNA